MEGLNGVIEACEYFLKKIAKAIVTNKRNGKETDRSHEGGLGLGLGLGAWADPPPLVMGRPQPEGGKKPHPPLGKPQCFKKHSYFK